MGIIVYKPHCAKCGAIINQEVTYKKMATGIDKNLLHYAIPIDIEPCRCACCGTVFDTIEIPIPKEREVDNGNDKTGC